MEKYYREHRLRRVEEQPFRPRPRKHTPPELPPGVVNVRRGSECVVLDLICDSCGQRIPRFNKLYMEIHFYAPNGPRGLPLTRCYPICPNCGGDFVLGRNIGDEDRFVVIAGVAQHFQAQDIVSDSDTNLPAYPDDLIRTRSSTFKMKRVH